MPRNLCQDQTIRWRARSSEGTLAISLECEATGNWSGRLPSAIIRNMASVLVVESCAHDQETPLAKIRPWLRYSGLERPVQGIDLGIDPLSNEYVTNVVAVDGHEFQRMFTLAFRKSDGRFGHQIVPMVLRGRACLECCLEVCYKAEYHVVVC